MYLAIIIFGIFLDQITKYFAASQLVGKSVFIIDNFFYLTYLENKGAAFGILQDSRVFFVLFTILVLIGITYYAYKHRGSMHRIEKFALAFLLSGALGNFIDRLLNGYVVDFFGLILPFNYHFPIFNVADLLVTAGCILFLIDAFFINNENKDKRNKDKRNKDSYTIEEKENSDG